MRSDSLAFRLFAAAAAWALVVLPITAFALISVYRGAVERNFDSRLSLFLTALVARTANVRGDIAANPPALRNPQFRLPFSGWYWQIKQPGSTPELVLTSESLLDQHLPLPSEQAGVDGPALTRSGYVQGPEKQRLRIQERAISLDKGSAGKMALSIAVAGNAAEIEATIAEFRTLLIVTLTVLGLGLVLATFFQVRWGLRPLRTIGLGLAAIRSGDAEELEGILPLEIEPLQKELNALIQSNRAIVERARTHVGNLAHALKTPLSVITNEAARSRTAFASKVSDQARLMSEQISHHLKRASMVAHSGVIGGQTRVQPVAKALVRTLARIYSQRGLDVQLECPKDALFQGEKHDLEEMIGNLLENACKWGKSSVRLKIAGSGGRLVITVDDDGPGLPEKDRESVMKRGRRLDETKPGSGLGLSIVAELVHLYKGMFSLSESDMGGVQARLDLPGS